MRETQVEAALTRGAAELVGRAYKWVSPSDAGVPDRLVVLPMPRCPSCGSACRVGAVELKAPGQVLRPLQQRQHETLQALGMHVGWADTPGGARAWLQGLARGLQ